MQDLLLCVSVGNYKNEKKNKLKESVKSINLQTREIVLMTYSRLFEKYAWNKACNEFRLAYRFLNCMWYKETTVFVLKTHIFRWKKKTYSLPSPSASFVQASPVPSELREVILWIVSFEEYINMPEVKWFSWW